MTLSRTTSLPRLRRADCGHWIMADLEPAGETDGQGHSSQPVYLCGQCLTLARPQSKVETKDVRPARPARKVQRPGD